MSVLLTPETIRHEQVQLNLLADSSFECVTVAQLKEHLKLRTAVTAEDGRLGELITAAREVIEALTNKVLIQQQWEQVHDSVKEVTLFRRTPVISVSKVEYIAAMEADTRIEFASTGYTYSKNRLAARSAWPTHRGFQSFIVTYLVGFGSHDANPDDAAKTATRAEVPRGLRDAVMQLAGHFYENREGQPAEIKYEVMAKNFATIPPNILTLCSRYRSWSLI